MSKRKRKNIGNEMEEVIGEFLRRGDQQSLFCFLRKKVAEACGSDINAALNSVSRHTRELPVGAKWTAFQLATKISKCERFQCMKLKLIADCQHIFQINDFKQIVKQNKYQKKQSNFNRLILISNNANSQKVPLNVLYNDNTEERMINGSRSSETLPETPLLSMEMNKRMSKILVSIDSSFQDKNNCDMTLKCILMLFNSKESELVGKSFKCLLSQLNNDSTSEKRKLKLAVLLYMMMTKVPIFWNSLRASIMEDIVLSITKYIAFISIQLPVSTNILGLFAILDPEAMWLKRWMHSYSCRKVAKSNLCILARKILRFLTDGYKNKACRTKSLAILHYSHKQINQFMYRYYCLFALNWIKYSDLIDLYTSEEWLQILGFIVNFWRTMMKKEFELSQILLHLASYQSAAPFLLNANSLTILRKMNLSNFIAIISTAFLHVDSNDIDAFLIKKEILNQLIPQFSEITEFMPLLSGNDSVWKQLLRTVSSNCKDSLQKLKFEKNDLLISLCDLCNEHSIEAFLKCAHYRIRVLPTKYVNINSTIRSLLVNELIDVLSLEEDSKQLANNKKELRNRSKDLFAVLVPVIWQPYSGIQILQHIICSSHFQELFRKIRIGSYVEAVRKIRILAVNLDLAIELRYNTKLMRTIGKCCMKWVDGHVEDEDGDGDGYNELILFYSFLVIGGPSEIHCKSVSIIMEPFKLRAVLEQFQIKSIVSNESTDFDVWSRTILLEEAKVTIDDKLCDAANVIDIKTIKDSGAGFETIGYPLFVKHFGALLDYAYYLNIISNRKLARMQISSLRLPYSMNGNECDWFHAVLFLILHLDVQLVNTISFKLYNHQNVATFWPSSQSNYPSIVSSKIFPIVQKIMGTSRFLTIGRILEREGISSFHFLVLCSNQVYLNFLDWFNVKLYVVKSITDGPFFQAKHFCAIMLHLEKFMRQMDHRDSLLTDLLRAAPLASFKYADYDAYIDKLYHSPT